MKTIPTLVLMAAIALINVHASAQSNDSIYFTRYRELREERNKAKSSFKAAKKRIDSLESLGNTKIFAAAQIQKTATAEEAKLLEDSLRQVSLNRNSVLSIIYSDNIKPTHIAESIMEVGGNYESVIDANINLSFFLLPKHAGWNIIINPRCNLRMLIQQESAPIRTPSNHISVIGFKPVLYNEGRYGFVTGSLNHHSNGQDPGAYNDDGTLNLVNGNFGVNYAEASGMLGRWFEHKPRIAIDMYIKLGLQADHIINKKEPRNPNTGERALKNQYGQWRTNFELSISRRADRETPASADKIERKKKSISLSESRFKYNRLMLDGSIVFINGLKTNIELKYYHKIPWSPNFMITAQAGWLGHDYYNIYFNEQTFVFRIGLAAKFQVGSGTRDADSENLYRKLLD